MSPELVKAIRDRIQQSQPKEEIKRDVLAMGHSDEVFEEAYVRALQDVKETIIESQPAPTAPVIGALPSVGMLLKRSFVFASDRFDLVLLLALPLLVSIVTMEVAERFSDNAPILAVASVATFIAMLVYFVNFMIALYIIAHIHEGRPLYKDGIAFVRKHFLALLLTYIITVLALWGGLLFFIIPAIIVSTYVYFAPLVLVYEGKSGMAALLSSRALVWGRWWPVTLKLFGVLFLAALPVLLLIGIYSAFVEWKGLNDWFWLGGDFIFESLMAFVGVMNLYAVNQLYHALNRSRQSVSASSFLAFRYWSLVIIGVASLALLVTAAVLAPRFLEEQVNEYELPIIEDATVLSVAVGTSHTIAEQFYEGNSQSYEGVCGVLQEPLMSLGEVVCNDEGGEWAVSVSDGVSMWCADRTTPAKQIKQPLGERVQCLDLP